MSSIHLRLDNNSNNEFLPGQTINGAINCFFNSKKTISAIKVVFSGKGETKWEESESYTDGDNRTQEKTVTYTAKEIYLNKEIFLIRGQTEVPAGNHVYQFSYTLPSTGLPQSFKGRYGHIRYSVKAVIIRPWTSDFVDKSIIVISTPFDLNDLPHLRNPVTTSVDKTMWHCCCFEDSGILTFNMSLPVTGFVSGQNVSIGAYVQNLTNVNTESVQFKIVQYMKYLARYPSSNIKSIENVMGRHREAGVGVHSEKSWTSIIKIPLHFSYPCFEYCTIMETSYALKAKIVVPSPHKDLRNQVALMIGTVPLTGVEIEFTGDPPATETEHDGDYIPESDQPSSLNVEHSNEPPPPYEEIERKK